MKRKEDLSKGGNESTEDFPKEEKKETIKKRVPM